MPEDGYIYVLAPDGRPLMPTKRRRHMYKLLKRGKARIASHVPLIIQLKYDTPGITQPLYGGTDPGRTNKYKKVDKYGESKMGRAEMR